MVELINGYYITEERDGVAFAVSQARYENDLRTEQDETNDVSKYSWWAGQFEYGINPHPLGGVSRGRRIDLIKATEGSYTLVNLTPHDVVLIKNGEVVRFAPSGLVARVAESSVFDGLIGEFPAVRKQYGAVEVLSRSDFLAKVPSPKVEPMPEPQKGLMYIVPMLVGQVLAGSRHDIIGPDFGIGGAARDKTGQITGASGFIRF